MKGTKKTKTTVIFKEKEWYREKIIEMVNQINDAWILKTIHAFVVGMTKEGD